MNSIKSTALTTSKLSAGSDGGAPQMAIYRGPNFMFDRLRTRLRFENSGTLNNAGVSHASARLSPTFAYDIDPNLGSTSMPGFTELATLYRFYRCTGLDFSVCFANNEAFNAQCFIAAVNFDPGANTAVSQNYLSSRTSKNGMVGPLTGMNLRTLKLDHIELAHFGGSANAFVDDAYSGLSSGGSPSNVMWVTWGVTAQGNLVSGLYVSTTTEIDIEFFELQTPAA